MNLQKLLCAELQRQLVGKDLSKARIPAGGGLLWKWFMDLHKTRQGGMNGPQPISYAEISAYRNTMGECIEPRHVKILITMDQTYLATTYDKQPRAPAGVKVLPPISAAPVTGGVFDAMFGGR